MTDEGERKGGAAGATPGAAAVCPNILDKLHVDQRIAALADRHHGIVTTQQLMRLGLDRRTISYRARTGRLHRLYQGVYAVGHAKLTSSARCSGGPARAVSTGYARSSPSTETRPTRAPSSSATSSPSPRNAALPEPQLNVLVGGQVVDAYWPQWKLVIELDSRAYHMSPRAFETDRVRDAVVQRVGCRVLRITHKRLNSQPTAVLEDILAVRQVAP